jgi:DMSO/TMAO reductase YedYZ molybdopterin-dependent catalytic subunit
MRAGAVAGASLTLLLAAAMYAGWRLAGLPFPPYDLFDWLTRALPGSLVTLWIDSAIVVLRALQAGSTAAAAKNVEQTIALVAFVAGGAALGAAMFAALRLSDEPGGLPGAVLGGVIGLAALVVERTLERVSSADRFDALWVIFTFVAWGTALGSVHERWRSAGAAAAVSGADAGDPESRRRFLVRIAWMAGMPSAMLAVGAAAIRRGHASLGARWSDTHALPNANGSVVAVAGTRPEFTPIESHYRVDVDTRPPRIDPAGWRLSVRGLVDRPLQLTLDDLRREEPLHQFITLACISNPPGGDLIGTTRWTGVALANIVAGSRPQAQATHAKLSSADGFFEFVDLAIAARDRRLMLAYAWDGVPLTTDHGFPLRLYVPDVYGMKQPKWIDTIELVKRWEPGYWVQRGWDRDGLMLAASAVDAAAFDARKGTVLAGGIAHAGARGVSRVQVRVDSGAWQEAELRQPLSDTTWVIWRAELTASSESHECSVRCVDGSGVEQPPPFHRRRL